MLRKVCGGSNLSTFLALWGIYIKKCISPVRIRLRVKKPRNASTKFRKTSESKKAEKSLEISAFLVFSRSDLNRPKDLYRAAKKDITRKSLWHKGFQRFLCFFRCFRAI